MMKRLQAILILLGLLGGMSMAFDLVPADGDFANHGLMAAMITKGVSSYANDKDTFAIMTSIFIAKELYDCVKPNPTGFSVQDLCADYLGYGLIKWEIKF